MPESSSDSTNYLRTAAPALFKAIGNALPFFKPKPGQTTTEWINRFTRNKRIHNLVDNVCGAFFAAAGSDLPADVFLYCLTEDTSFKSIGYTVGGTIEVWKGLSNYVRAKGGEVWLNSPVKRLLFDPDGLVKGAEIEDARPVANSTWSRRSSCSSPTPRTTSPASRSR